MSDTLVIDLETKKSLPEVGGEAFMKDLGISVAGVFSYNKNSFFAFEEHELPELEKMLEQTGHLIGFNINHFDIPVLKPYLTKVNLGPIAVTDMFEDASSFLGHRVGLNALAKATLKESKSGHGLEALQWFKDGRIEDVKKYCLDDVRLTRDLYEYGKQNGHVLFESYTDGKVHSVPVRWGEAFAVPVLKVLEDAYAARRRLAIEYVSSENNDGLGFHKSRLIDVYKINDKEVEAYCHLRKSLRNFRLNRILRAEFTSDTYAIPPAYQGEVRLKGRQDFQSAMF